MKFYTYGNPANPVMLLFPGTCCHHKTFDYVVPYLQEHFHVAVASYDGFDETEETTFPDMTVETEKIEDYVKEQFGGSVFAAYGCSLGGSFVGLLIQRRNIHIDHGFIGSSDLDQAGKLTARLESSIVAPVFHHVLQSGKLPSFLDKRFSSLSESEKAYIYDFLRFFGVGEGAMDMSFVSTKSIYNQFYSDLITPLEDAIDVEGTRIHVFYALKMGAEYEKRYLQHFKDPDIRRHDLQHEELLVRLPEYWTKEVLDCCGMEGGEAFTGENEAADNEDAGNETAGSENEGNNAAGNNAAGSDAADNENAGNETADNEPGKNKSRRKLAGILAAAAALTAGAALIVRKLSKKR